MPNPSPRSLKRKLNIHDESDSIGISTVLYGNMIPKLWPDLGDVGFFLDGMLGDSWRICEVIFAGFVGGALDWFSYSVGGFWGGFQRVWRDLLGRICLGWIF